MLKTIKYLFIFTTIAVIASILFTILHNSQESTLSRNTEVKTEPIQPSFNTSVIETLKKRQIINPNLSEKLKTSSLNPSPSPEEKLVEEKDTNSLEQILVEEL